MTRSLLCGFLNGCKRKLMGPYVVQMPQTVVGPNGERTKPPNKNFMDQNLRNSKQEKSNVHTETLYDMWWFRQDHLLYFR